MSLRGEYKSEDDTRRTFVKSITLGITQESGLALPVIIIFLLLLPLPLFGTEQQMHMITKM